MLQDLVKLKDILDTKLTPIVEAIEKSDPTTEEYSRLLDNFSMSITLSSNLSKTLIGVEQALNKEKVEEKVEEK